MLMALDRHRVGAAENNHATALLRRATRWDIQMLSRQHFRANLQWEKAEKGYSLLLVCRLNAAALFALPTGWNFAADNRPPPTDSRGNQTKALQMNRERMR